MRVAILQSNYIPWKGYFDIIGMVDLFIFHDDLQYTKGDWRNRNKIKTKEGAKWITIPCGTSEKRLICDVKLTDFSWQLDHWKKMEVSYRDAPYFTLYEDYFRSMWLGRKWENLSELNQVFIRDISKDFLKINTEFDDSRRYGLKLSKGERVIELLKKAGASTYLSGPAAKNYLNPDDFVKAGIELEWMDYSGYREYPQAHPPFTHAVSIVDMLFNLGPQTVEYMKFQQHGSSGVAS